jgi:NTP pyrophosphatase (non-canonical NTP hydrolase)
MDMTQIYQKTIDTWGEEAQYDQMIEECAELIAALKHFKRGKIEDQDVINELADVTLMVGQLTWMMGDKKVAATVEKKLQKLETLLNAE